MKIRAVAKWNPKDSERYRLERGQGLFLLRVEPEFRERWGKELHRLRKHQEEAHIKALGEDPRALEADSLTELEVTVEIFYRKRNLEQNRLMWKLYEIEANWINGTPLYRAGYWSKKLPERIITPEEIHQDDLETYCEKTEYFVPKDSLFAFRRGVEYELGKVKKAEPVSAETVRVEVWKTTSFLNRKEFSQWVDRIIDRIEDSGLLRVDEGEFLMLKRLYLEITRKGEK